MWIINQEKFKAYNKEKDIEINVIFKKPEIFINDNVFNCFLIIKFISIEEEIQIFHTTFSKEDIYYTKDRVKLYDMKQAIDFIEIIFKKEYLYVDKIEEMYYEFKNHNKKL